MAITIRIEKVRAGVRFDVISAKADPTIIIRALRSAESWYKDAVAAELRRSGLAQNALARHARRVEIAPLREDRDPATTTILPTGGTLTLEPWGFADPPCTEEEPTDERSRLLLCYQAPLKRMEHPDGVKYETVKAF